MGRKIDTETRERPGPAQPLAVVALALGVLLPGCDGPLHPARPRLLAAEFEIAELVPQKWFTPAWGGPALSLSPAEGGRAYRVSIELGPDDWSAGPVPGTLLAHLPAPAVDPESTELVADGRVVPRWELTDDLRPAEINHGWALSGGEVFLATETAPAHAVLSMALPLGAPSPSGWRLDLIRLTADGIPLSSGAERRFALEAASTPRELTFRSYAACSPPGGGAAAQASFTLFIDGEEATTFEQSAPQAGAQVDRRILVPAKARSLTFRFNGPAGLAAVLSPRLAPVQIDPRPDIVVILADTLRADMVAAYRGDAIDPAPMPTIDALARRSRVYLQARSNSSWTLPAQASLLTGLPPLAHGAISADRALHPDLPRLASRLQAAGYRTAAVTEGAYLSASYGLDRGFESFDERSRDLRLTVERALAHLRSKDSRPLFLYVQSYRAHAPYIPGALDFAKELNAQLPVSLHSRLRVNGDAQAREFRGFVERSWVAYLGAVNELDRGLAPLLEAIESPARGKQTFLIFTSDHGEAFGEHVDSSHGHGVWESLLRIPLIVQGPGIEIGTDDAGVSLIDLAPTIAGWAGVEIDSNWPGIPLVDAEPNRATFAWTCPTPPHPNSRAIVEGRHKWIEWDDDSRVDAFDLTDDPLEARPLLETGPRYGPLSKFRAAWPTVPEFEAREATLGAAEILQLKALGYLSDE